ncbi:Taurine-binding periplasmic protein TauA [plant metagenome]|uniref:Taurine-binding periplasmic protein TauA n=2 Tax=plant metagenome TaxID=1297885 RepID=A0A484VAB5_9ZZZZ
MWGRAFLFLSFFQVMGSMVRFSFVRAWGAGLLGASLMLGAASAMAETSRIAVADQFGLGSLLWNVVKDQKLIEKHGKAAGVEIAVEWKRLSGGAAMNEAVLSGSIDVGTGGVPPLLTLWDRTRGRQDVKAISAIVSTPHYLVTNQPRIRSLDDFSDADRIAVPAVNVSIQARLLQMAAAKQHGQAQFNRYDALTVALPHADATSVLLAGGNAVVGSFAGEPFTTLALRNPSVHKVISSYEILGGPHTVNLIWATSRFREREPKAYRAVLAALAEAQTFVQADPQAAADVFLRQGDSSLPREQVLALIQNPETRYTLVPENTFPFAQFMHQVGAIKHLPASWKDYFFEEAHALGGS